MNAEEVTRRQARAIKSKVEPFRQYLYRLRTRMAHRGFTPGDELFELVKSAELAVGELFVDLEVRTREGPTAEPEPIETPWLEQKSARKRHDRR
ncbi:MAG: hypothetical protein AB7G28_14155 [Pirellulales bacterium]